MKRCFAGLLLLWAMAATFGQPGSASLAFDADMTYRELYEQGYYAEAINVLDSLVARDSVADTAKLYCLAACHIVQGEHERGAIIFGQLLAGDSLYTLDSLYTPPKIFEVFRKVKSRIVLDRVAATAADTTSDSATPSAATMAPAPDSGTIDKSKAAATGDTHERVRAALSWPPGLLPCGGGQFLRREPVKGILLCAAQAASLGLCIWATRTREGYRDDRYGWYDGNRAAWNRYTNYTRAGAGLLLGSYTCGIIDYFLLPRIVQKRK